MTGRWMKRIIGAALIAAASTAAGPAWAQSANMFRVRGVIESAAPDSVTVKSREGDTLTVRLAPDAAVTYPVKLALADIKPGSYIGRGRAAAAGRHAEGAGRLGVSGGAARTGEGHRPFDLMPESTMTNATVASAISAVQGETVRLTYKDGEKTLTIPPGTPIVTYAPGDRTDLVKGAQVSFTVMRGPEGALSAQRVTVSKNGVVPPV